MDCFSTLPEDCISLILSKTSPRDACQLSVVSSAFQLASQSNTVWNSFLPSSDYISNFEQTSSFNLLSSKKDLFLFLCRSFATFLDKDNSNFKVFAKLDHSGKTSAILQSTSLSISTSFRGFFIRELRKRKHNIRFEGMCREEIVEGADLHFHGKLNTHPILSPNTTYSVYFIFNFYLNRTLPQYVKVFMKFSSETGKIRSVTKFRTNFEKKWGYEDGDGNGRDGGEMMISIGEDGFRELKLGEFYNGGNDGGVLEISLDQNMYGVIFLSVLGIEFRPK